MTPEQGDRPEGADQATPETPEPAGRASQPGRKTLYRSKDNQMLAGVAGGLADYFAVDVLLVRLAFLLLLIPGGVAVPLYLAAWILVPLEGDRYSIGERMLNRVRGSGDDDEDEDSWVWIVLIVIGVLAIGNVFNRGPDGWFFWGGGAPFWSLLLIAAGIWLYRQDQKQTGERSDSSQGKASIASAGNGGPPPVAAGADRPAPRRPEPKPRPEPSRLGRYTFASMLVVVGLIATIDNSVGAIDLAIGQYAAIAVGVVGIGLLVGSVWGRSRPLVLLGFLILPFTFIGFNLDLPVSAGSGERSHTPATAGDLTDYELFAGELNLDLTDMRWDESSRTPVETEVGVAFGQINVVVPSDVVVEFDGRALAGQVSLFNRHHAGLNAHLAEVAGPSGGPRLILESDVMFGQISVERASTPARQVRP